MHFKSERSLGVAIFYFLLPLGGITLITLLTYFGIQSLRWFLIYPQDKEEFIKIISEKCSNIRMGI